MNPGLYIHVPFCLRKCPYCDFYSESDLTLKSAYLEALSREMDLVAEALQAPGEFDTVYFGGGTPSLLDPVEVEGVLNEARSRFFIAREAEVTLEVNPGTVTAEKLAGLRQAGVTRLNIGVQSLDEKTLKFLGRLHNAEQARDILSAARSCGFTNIGADLIYGVPGQGKGDVLSDVAALLSYDPEHLSCYMLTLEEGTPLYARHGKKAFSMPDDTVQGTLFETVSDALTQKGYLHYEVSNFARSQAHVSRHNTKYWEMVTTVGLGPSAHGFDLEGLFRWWNVAHLGEWMDCLKKGKRPIEGTETLGQGELMTEALYLGLRRMEGVNLAVFHRRFSVDLAKVLGACLSGFEEEGLMVVDADSIRLTRKGFAVADGVVLRLLQAL
ncbi:coproporphyrinogen III oxidase [Desulfoluna limicola]|uniref:Heme chaperone HemW n=1 Tax=Desulfoluna limicola TaxID=2810562 RepID=A0ABM7PIJ5_9BACT|nr:radical SAM family heme chaperone HemW [Desulfoluna limicola]BCS97116.1 coproporphyrinogen III oxidase [Desulfoluna limicola]